MESVIYCKNQLCIYYEDRRCLLKSIDLDEHGRCETQLCVSLTPEELAKRRAKDRQKAKENGYY